MSCALADDDEANLTIYWKNQGVEQQENPYSSEGEIEDLDGAGQDYELEDDDNLALKCQKHKYRQTCTKTGRRPCRIDIEQNEIGTFQPP